MYWTGRPLRRSVMARCRAVNSSCMGTSVVRPLAVAHGGYSRRSEAAAEVPGAAEAGTTDRERSDQLSVCFNKKLNDQLSGKPARSAVGSQLTLIGFIATAVSLILAVVF